jgi:Holliday junction resolvase RusA-like endonuclease
MRSVSFFVPGIPAPGGSKRSMVHRHTGKIVTMEDCKRTKDWRSMVAIAAAEECRGDLFTGPISVNVTFQMPRPKGHYREKPGVYEVRKGAPRYPTTRPDATKLWRSTEDALKGIAWKDDSQVVRQTVWKMYGTPGASISIMEVVD